MILCQCNMFDAQDAFAAVSIMWTNSVLLADRCQIVALNSFYSK